MTDTSPLYASAEDAVLEVVGAFLKHTTIDTVNTSGITIWDSFSQDARPTDGQYISVKLMSSQEIGMPWGEDYNTTDGYLSNKQLHEALFEVVCYRVQDATYDTDGNLTASRVTPFSRLNMIKRSVYFKETRHQYLTDLGVTVLDTSSISDASTVLDESIEHRARMNILVQYCVTTTDTIETPYANQIKTTDDTVSGAITVEDQELVNKITMEMSDDVLIETTVANIVSTQSSEIHEFLNTTSGLVEETDWSSNNLN